MPVLDHLGVTIDDLSRATARFDPIMTALGFTRHDADRSVSWYRDDEAELILFPAREPGTGPHRHGRVGWQHLAFAAGSRAEVDRLHAIARAAGWTVVREPKEYPRFTDRYYASFVEDDDGIRIEFMHNPPAPAVPPGAEWTAALDGPVPDDVARLLASVPEWFGRPEANADYIRAAATDETWTVRDAGGAVVGVTLVRRHLPHVAEIHLTVVDRAAHGRGVGTAMMAAIEADARGRGVRLLEVKTLGASHPDPGYARTRRFYERTGFLALEETGLWGEDSPCLIMVKPLA